MKKCLLIDNDNSVSILYFKEVFAKWNIPLIVCNNPEDSFMKFIIEKPELVLLSADLEIDYLKIVDYMFSKNISVIFYGDNIHQLPHFKKSLVKALLPEPYNINLFKLKTIFFSDEVLKKELFTESASHIEMVINEKVCVVEMKGSISWEQVHQLKYQLIHLFNLGEIIGIIFIFHEIEESDAKLFEDIEHLLSLVNQLQINAARVQILASEERIKTMIKAHPNLKKIEFSDSYIDAFLKIQGKEIKEKDSGAWIFKLNSKTVFPEDMYDECGTLVKKKGQTINKEEIEKLSKENTLKLYTAKELAFLGRPFNININSDDFLVSQVNAEKQPLETKKSVLIIDDDLLTLKLLKKIIEKLNFKVVTASNGVEGFDYATSMDPALIIVDLMMPGLNGVDLIKNYKELRGDKAAPIIVASTISMKNIIQPILEMGVDYIIKPVKISVLISKISKIMKE